MKRCMRYGFAVGVLTVGMVVAGAASAADAPQGNAARGKETFIKIGCYSCHSYEGQGGRQGPKLAPNPLPFATIENFVRNTSGAMPPFTKQVLSDAQLADIYAYLKSIPASPKADSIPLLKQFEK